jgi:hypothetical protein
MSPSNVRIGFKLLEFFKNFGEREFRSKVAAIVHESRTIKQGRYSIIEENLLVILKIGEDLIDGC